MVRKNVLPPEVLPMLLRYDPETGKLFWRERGPEWFSDGAYSAERRAAAFNAKNAGKEAFTAVSRGYKVGRIFDELHLSHRVIWAIETGQWPEGDIDHEDGDPANNRWGNIRDVSHADNNRNMKRPANNTSGCTGVSWHQRRRLWEAYIGYRIDRERLGWFKSLEDAIAARKAAEIRHGYHPNHDRVAA